MVSDFESTVLCDICVTESEFWFSYLALISDISIIWNLASRNPGTWNPGTRSRLVLPLRGRFDVWHSTFGVGHLELGVWRLGVDIWCLTYDVWRLTSPPTCIFDIYSQHFMLDIQTSHLTPVNVQHKQHVTSNVRDFPTEINVHGCVSKIGEERTCQK